MKKKSSCAKGTCKFSVIFYSLRNLKHQRELSVICLAVVQRKGEDEYTDISECCIHNTRECTPLVQLQKSSRYIEAIQSVGSGKQTSGYISHEVA